MKNLKRKISFFLFSSLTLSLFLGGYILYERYIVEQSGKKWIEKKEDLKNLLKVSEILQKIWLEGQTDQLSIKGFNDCKKELQADQNVDASYFRCNPGFLECFLKKVSGKVIYKKYGNRSIASSVIPLENNGEKSFGQVITRWSHKGQNIPNYSYVLKMRSGEMDLVFLMQNSCNEVFLPERNYSYSKYIRAKDILWDNFNQSIFIDKFQVTFRDIMEWKSSLKLPYKIPNKFIPPDSAFGLTLQEMKNYCSFRGKQLLQAHIWDAATYIPQDLREKRKKIVRKGPYPWTKKRISFLWKAKNDPSFKFEKKYCKKVFTKDCLPLVPLKRHSISSSSWSGVFQVLGGYPEAMKNPFHDQKNLKLSSFYFGAGSLWHELGVRGFWDGRSFDINRLGIEEKLTFEKNLSKVENLPSSDIRITFRCMRKLK